MAKINTYALFGLLTIGFLGTACTQQEPQSDESEESSTEEPVSELEARFPDYEPKLSADTLWDYRFELAERLADLPEIKLEDVTDNIQYLDILVEKADQNPGHWEDGQVAIGADPREYVPSDDELLAAEFGDALATFLTELPPETAEQAWQGHDPITYKRFFFRHVDVMGSGRFFYASPPEEVVIDF